MRCQRVIRARLGVLVALVLLAACGGLAGCAGSGERLPRVQGQGGADQFIVAAAPRRPRSQGSAVDAH